MICIRISHVSSFSFFLSLAGIANKELSSCIFLYIWNKEKTDAHGLSILVESNHHKQVFVKAHFIFLIMWCSERNYDRHQEKCPFTTTSPFPTTVIRCLCLCGSNSIFLSNSCSYHFDHAPTFSVGVISRSTDAFPGFHFIQRLCWKRKSLITETVSVKLPSPLMLNFANREKLSRP